MIFRDKGPQNIFVGFFTLLTIILFGTYLFSHAVNMPYMDDMELVDNINGIKDNPSRFFPILVQHLNDHRLVFSRIGIMMSYVIDGTINFKTSVILGYFNLILLGFSFFLVYRSTNQTSLAFIPVVLFLFSANICLAHLWGLLAFENTLAVAFSILCLYFLKPDKREQWYWAVLFAVFATLTNLGALR